jgi:ClpP class serine protease
VILKVLAEVEQAASVRQPLLAALEERFEHRCFLLFFTSFVQPVIIEDVDVDIIESVLQKEDLTSGLTLVINSPGGDGLAAERIINLCRAYSQDNFEAIVPKMAKSAATMICFGARKIWMSPTAELGSIDTQILRGKRLIPVYDIIKSYEELLEAAVQTKGHVEPYLQLLGS